MRSLYLLDSSSLFARDKHFDNFCKREFLYYDISRNKYLVDIIDTFNFHTTNFKFTMVLGKIRTSIMKYKNVSYINIYTEKETKAYKLLVMYKNYEENSIYTSQGR